MRRRGIGREPLPSLQFRSKVSGTYSIGELNRSFIEGSKNDHSESNRGSRADRSLCVS